MKVKKLTWAGVYLQSGNTSILIDPIEGISEGAEAKVFGKAKESFITFDSFEKVDAILQTHTHEDHFDAKAIMKTFGDEIPVLVPIASVEEAKATNLKNVIGVNIGDQFEFGNFKVTPSYSVDGFGSSQFSWIVDDGERKIIHSGDTLWHGYWWQINRLYGPFDAALLPVNGAKITLPQLMPSGELACMDPEQAVSASKLLNAKRLIPIHFHTYISPPSYIETPRVLDRLVESAKQKEIDLTILKPGEEINI